MPEAVYFDLDGTLFDDRQYVRAGLRRAGEVLAERTGVDLTDELLDTYFEEGIQESTFDVVLADHDLPMELVPVLVDAYHDNDASLDPFPGTGDVLEVLSERYDLGLVTGGRNGREKLRRLGLEGHFRVVVVAPEVGTSKREPDPFEAALDTLGVDPEEAVYVGDRPELDFPQPNRLGLTTVRVRSGRYADAEASGDERPDVTIDTLEELPELLAGEVPAGDTDRDQV